MAEGLIQGITYFYLLNNHSVHARIHSKLHFPKRTFTGGQFCVKTINQFVRLAVNIVLGQLF